MASTIATTDGKDAQRRRSARPHVAAAVVAMVTAVLGIAALAGDAKAAACSIKWVGGEGTNWGSSNWSPQRAPVASDNVCIPAGFIVEVTQPVSVRTVQSESTLAIGEGGDVQLTDTSDPSSTTTLLQRGGDVGGPGTLVVKGLLEWTEGTNSEEGTTEVASGGELQLAGSVLLGARRTLQIDAGATAAITKESSLRMDESAEVSNEGTFTITERSTIIAVGDGAGQVFRNLGLLTTKENDSILVPFENQGTLDIATEALTVAAYTQYPTGTLHVHVRGGNTETGFTKLVVEEGILLAGRLLVTTKAEEEGFVPEAGQRFRVILSGFPSEGFASVQETPPGIGGGLGYGAESVDGGVELFIATTTALTTSLSGGGLTGATISVPEGTAVSDTATLAGASSAGATGTATYNIYSDSSCANLVESAGTKPVTGGVAGASDVKTLAPGTYYWQASYSGDANNVASRSACGSEIETVTARPPGGKGGTGTGQGGVLAFKLPAPALGKTVNVEVVSGVVYIKLPPGAQASAVGPLAALESLSKGVGFVPLTEARQVPVGSTLDTRRGVARLTTATGTAGRTQNGNFSAGIFSIFQNRAQHGLSELRLVNGTSSKRVCATIGKKASAASKRLSSKVLGRLSGNAHGKFTTRGRYSAATVRGTAWSVANQCNGTLTKVTRGVVAVRDFFRRRTVTLRAGQRYLAKAP